MLLILSPAKTMDTHSRVNSSNYSIPQLLELANPLVRILKEKTTTEIAGLMKVNPNLAQLTFERFQQWHTPFNRENAKQAVFTYRGEVFNGLQIDSFTEPDLSYSQNHFLILSGLYGVLRPMDLIQPYRLEMGTRLSVGKAKNLYQYWKADITNAIREVLNAQGDNTLINLASNEYFKSIDRKILKANIITPVFKEHKDGKAVIITMYAKKARGMMARFLLRNQINSVESLMSFNENGYYYDDALSTEKEIVFSR